MKLGRIELDSGFTLEATTSEATLLDAVKGDARPLVQNGVYRSYLLPRTTLNGRTFTPSVYFKDGRLVSVQLSWVDPEIRGGSPWEDFSFARERSIALANASWLAASLELVSTTATYTFEWGTIWSGFDEKSGFSSIVIGYNQAVGR